MLQTLQEPDVNLGQFLNTFYSITFFKSLSNSEDTQVGRICQLIVKVVELRMVIAYESMHALSDHTETLLDHLLKGTANGHNLAHRLHRRTNQTADTSEFGEVPARNLTDHIVELWRNIGTGGRSHLTNLVERIAECNLGGNEGEGIACSL